MWGHRSTVPLKVQESIQRFKWPAFIDFKRLGLPSNSLLILGVQSKDRMNTECGYICGVRVLGLGEARGSRTLFFCRGWGLLSLSFPSLPWVALYIYMIEKNQYIKKINRKDSPSKNKPFVRLHLDSCKLISYLKNMKL